MVDEVLEYIILDAGPIIRGHILQLFQRTQNVITIREVMEEVRDSKSRAMLEQLPYEIQEREPSIEAVKAVVDFAKKSGTFAALSKTDLKLIALTLMLEKETSKKNIKVIESLESLEVQLQLSNGKNTMQPISESKSQPFSSTRKHGCSYKDMLQVHNESPGPAFDSSSQQRTGLDTVQVSVFALTDEKEQAYYISEGVLEEEEEEEEEGDEKDDDVGVEEGEYEEWPPLTATISTKGIVTDSNASMGVPCSLCSSKGSHSNEGGNSDGSIWKKASALMSECPEDWPTLQASCSIPYHSDDDRDGMNDNDDHVDDKDKDNEIDSDTYRESCDENQIDHNDQDNSVTVGNLENNSSTGVEVLLHDMHINEIETNSTAESNSMSTETLAAKVQSKVSFSRSSAILRGGVSGGWSAAASARAAAEDDGIGWISQGNITSHLSALGNSLGRASMVTIGGGKSKNRSKSKSSRGGGRVVEAAEKARVACLTTDFSMQNVLMQLGLKVLSVDGLLVKSVKQFVLRCMACYQVHFQMDRLFCSRCGAHHLSRVAASIDSSPPGSDQPPQLRLHLKKNYHPQLKGLQYSLPAPGKQDRYSGEILLREDQLLTGIWRQKSVRVRRDIASAFGEDVTSAVGLHLNKGQDIYVGLGSRNPNAVRGRERRGQKKKGSGR